MAEVGVGETSDSCTRTGVFSKSNGKTQGSSSSVLMYVVFKK